jgi:hypothetical protein
VALVAALPLAAVLTLAALAPVTLGGLPDLAATSSDANWCGARARGGAAADAAGEEQAGRGGTAGAGERGDSDDRRDQP